MNFIQFLFKLLHRFNLMGDDFGKTKEEAELWYAELRTDPDIMSGAVVQEGKKVPFFVRKMKLFLEQWYGKVLLAILYIVAIRWIHDYMNPEEDSDDED